jgi:6-phosphogluconolactonase (cycloisomerase 2 family)
MKTKISVHLNEGKSWHFYTSAVICLISVVGFLFSSCKKTDPVAASHGNLTTDLVAASGAKVVYIETNDFTNQNAILAYRDNGSGQLQQIPGSPFAAGDKGIANPKQMLGPDDSDTQIIITPNSQYLLAVNSGGNTIAVFRIQSDGSLVPVPGSPFSSGGENPVSLDYSEGFLYVANKSVDSNVKPNYATFKFNDDGSLTLISKIETTAGSSPSQILISNDKKFAFSTDFLGFMLTPVRGTLRSFILSSHMLQAVAGTPYTIPATGGALGLWQNPLADILYVGFPLAGEIGIYRIDETSGALTYQSAVEAGPAVCWLRTTKDGKYLYSLNSGVNAISIFNTSSAASPATIGILKLKEPGPVYSAPFTTSEDFSPGFSPDEHYFYVVSQYTNPNFSFGHYNLLHVLVKGDDGRLTEPGQPLQLPVSNTVRPQGVAVLMK